MNGLKEMHLFAGAGGDGWWTHESESRIPRMADGVPIGWTDLGPLEMGKFRQWFASHGES